MAKGKIGSGYNPITMFICSHIPFRVPQFVNEHPEIYKIITNCNDPFPPTKVDLLRVDKMKCDYGSDQNLCLNEWRMINAIYNMKYLPEYIGICHYRRYFDPGVISRINMKILEENGYEMVIGQPVVYKDVIKADHDSFTYYGYFHNYKDFLTYEKIIREQYPSMLEAFLEMKEQPYLYNSAMMILKRDDFIDLCEYTFDVYETMKKEFGIHNDKEAIQYVTDRQEEYIKPYNSYYDITMQARLLSFGIERICTNTWLREKRDDGTCILDHAAQVQWFMPNENEIKV